MEIIKCNKTHYTTLSGIWERSVRTTHDFLSEDSIEEIKESLISDYFPYVDIYAIDDNGRTTGFIGLSEDTIEMLFIDSDRLRHGYGSILIDLAKREGATKVNVNEQNSHALAFYTAKGFRITGRDATDEAGRPYPILHLSL